MSIGALLGGAINRYGEKNRENWERQQKLEDIGRRASFDALLGHFEKNYQDMLPEEQEALITRIETTVPGIKKGSLGPLVGGVRSISQIIPAVQAGAPPVTQRTSMDQLPTPSESIPSSIAYAPVPAHTIRTPSQTPNEVRLERKLGSDRLMRQERLNEIRVSDLPPEYKDALEASAMGLPAAASIETAQIRAKQAADAQEAKSKEFRGAGRVVVRNGMPLPVKTTGTDELIIDPQTGQWTPYTPMQGDEIWQKEQPLGTVQGATDVYSLEKTGPNKGTVKPLGVGVRPRATASGGAAKSRDFRDEMALRKDFENHPITKQADETARQVRLAENAIAKGSTDFVVIDQALINVFNKMIDPNSVVREGEYARTIDNTPLLNRIKGKMAAVAAGGAGLTTEERRALVDISKRFAADSQAAFGARATEYRRMATERQMNPKNVVIERAGAGAAAPAGGWDSQKEARYQELLRKRGGK